MDFSNYSLLLIKPDAFEEVLDPILIAGLEAQSLNIIFRKITTLTREQASSLYSEKKGFNYFEKLICFMTELPTMILIAKAESNNATQISQEYKVWARKNMKRIRFDLNQDDLDLLDQGIHPQQEAITREMALRNIIHVSDDPEPDINFLAEFLTDWELKNLEESDPDLFQYIKDHKAETARNRTHSKEGL